MPKAETMPDSTPMSLLGVMDVGGSHAYAGVLDTSDSHRRILANMRSAIDSHADRDELLRALLQPMLSLHRPGMPWTIAMPGPFDYARGRGDFEGVGKFQSIAAVDLRGTFAQALRIAETDVRFLNDAEAFAVGEWTADAHRADRFVGITLGTGIGSAFLDHGQAVRRGSSVPPNGWAHLIEVDGAPLEDLVSTSAIVAAYRASTGVTLTVREIAAAATAGDSAASTAFGEAIRTLGRALAPWLVRFAADVLVIGGAISGSWHLVEPALRAGFEDAVPGLSGQSLRRARLGEDAALLGAAEWTRATANPGRSGVVEGGAAH